MSNQTKVWLISAAVLIFIGCIIFLCVMSALKWDFKKLSTEKTETNDYKIEENYKNISVKTNTADVVFILSENSDSSVKCIEKKNVKHSVTVKDDTLIIEVVDTRKWYEHIGISFSDEEKVTVTLPKGEYGALTVKGGTGDIKIPNNFKFESIDLSLSTGDVKSYADAADIKIKTDTGSIKTENLSAENLHLSVSTGDITVSDVNCTGEIKIDVSTGKTNLTNIKCEKVISSGDTGAILLTNVVATEKFSIKRSTGDIKFENSDAKEVYAETSTGDIKGTLLSEKIFITKTSTGNINVPKSVSGGRCELTTSTGSINISVLPK